MAGVPYVLADPGSGGSVGDIPAEGRVILCGKFWHVSQPPTHPRGAMLLSGMPVHNKVSSPNLPLLSLPRSLLLAPNLRLSSPPCSPVLRLPSPQSRFHHIREYAETPVQLVCACTRTAALSAAATVRSSISFVISGFPVIPPLSEFLPRMWKTPPTNSADGRCVCCR